MRRRTAQPANSGEAPSSLRLGLAQVRQTHDRDDNRAAIMSALDEAADRDVDLLCFPEAQTIGYRVGIAEPQAPVPEDWLEETHEEVARRCARHRLACVLGTEVPAATGRPYNSALVVDERGRILEPHHKTRLTPADAAAYECGSDPHTYELCGITVGVVICFEAYRFADTTAECVRRGAQLILHPQNNAVDPSDWKLPVFHGMITTRAAENSVWFASCNACLEHQNSRCLVAAPDGTIVAQSELKVEELLVADIEPARATRAMFRIGEALRADGGAPSGATLELFEQLRW